MHRICFAVQPARSVLPSPLSTVMGPQSIPLSSAITWFNGRMSCLQHEDASSILAVVTRTTAQRTDVLALFWQDSTALALFALQW